MPCDSQFAVSGGWGGTLAKHCEQEDEEEDHLRWAGLDRLTADGDPFLQHSNTPCFQIDPPASLCARLHRGQEALRAGDEFE